MGSTDLRFQCSIIRGVRFGDEVLEAHLLNWSLCCQIYCHSHLSFFVTGALTSLSCISPIAGILCGSYPSYEPTQNRKKTPRQDETDERTPDSDAESAHGLR